MTRPAIAAALLFPGAAPGLAWAAADPLGSGGLIQTLFGLIVVLAFIGVAAWLARRLGHAPLGASGELRVLGGLSVGARERVVLVQIGETQLLIGVAPGRVQLLHALEHPIPVPAASAAGKEDFAQRLAAMLRPGVKK